MQSIPLVASFQGQSDYPRPQGPLLQTHALRPADVLLSRGEGDISDAIVASDGGSYSHAALWSGSSIIEARLDGVRERAWVGERDVYRYMVDGQPLGAEVAQRIVDIARAKVGREYATHELYLLGALFTLGLTPRRSLLGRTIAALGGSKAERLEQWLDSLPSDVEPLYCTELVAGSYYHALEDRSLALRIVPIAQRPREDVRTRGPDDLLSAEELELLQATQKRCRELMMATETSPPTPTTRARKLLWGTLAIEIGSQTKLGVVTPADLQFSPSLTFCGRVADKEGESTHERAVATNGAREPGRSAPRA